MHGQRFVLHTSTMHGQRFVLHTSTMHAQILNSIIN